MYQFSPLSQRTMAHALRSPVLTSAQGRKISLARNLTATVSALALFAATGAAYAQQAAPAPDAQATQQTTGAATQPQGGQITMRPVEVTAAKPKKPAKRRAATPAATNAAAQPAAEAGATAPVTVQAQTQIGRITAATPIAGTVVDKDEIAHIRPADVQRELLPQVPGVSMVRNLRFPIGGKGYTNDLMDGFSMKSTSLGNVGFLDEVNTWDIESIEITRGPGSVLYSSKAVGGTINVITRDPPAKPELGVWGDAGSYGLQRLGAHVAGSSENGGIGYSLNASTMQEEGWRDRSEREKQMASGKFVMKPDADTKVTFRAEYVDAYKEYPGAITEDEFNKNWRQADATNLYEDLHYYTTMIDVKRRVGEGGELTFAWVNHRNWGTNACPAGCSSTAATTRQVEMDYVDDNLRGVFRQDFDFLKSRVYLGVDAFLSEKSDDTFNRTGFTRKDLYSAFTVNETTIAPFAQYEFSPLDHLRFTLGVRDENYDLDIDDRKGTKDGSKSYSALVRKGGVTYEYANNHFLWGSIGEGFFVPSTDQTVSGANAKDLPPETSLTYSAGVRGKLAGPRLTYDVGVYHSVINDMAVSLPCPNKGVPSAVCPDGGGTRATYAIAAGKVEFQGVESTVSWRPIDMVKLSASHTFALNTYVDFKESVDYSGKVYQWSPKHHLNGRVTVYPVKGLSVELESDYISRYFTNALNSDSYQRPTLYNMRIGYEAGNGMELWAHAYNLFDTKYAERVSYSSTERTYSEGYHPLTVRAGISYKW